MDFAKPKIGLVLMANEWFWKYKMFGQDFLELIENDCKFIYEKIKESTDVIYNGLVLNTEQAKSSIREIKRRNVDLLIICPVIWTSDIPFIEMLQEIPKSTPIILWFYVPSMRYPEKLTISEFIRATGPVGAAQFASVLKRDGRRFKIVVGSREDEEIFSEINQYARAAKLSNDLKNIRIGLLPSGYPDIANTWCDEFKITSRLGPRLIRISVYEYYKTAQELSEEEVEAFVRQLERKL
jgi:L-arabinose isomerase